MFEILLVVILSLFIFGYILVTLGTDTPPTKTPPVKVRGQPQDESRPREAVYARIRQRLQRKSE